MSPSWCWGVRRGWGGIPHGIIMTQTPVMSAVTSGRRKPLRYKEADIRNKAVSTAGSLSSATSGREHGAKYRAEGSDLSLSYR